MVDLLDFDFSPDLVEHIRTVDDDRIRYKFRARTTGTKAYICVFCGWHNRFRVTPANWTHRCDNEECRRSMGFGDIGYVLPSTGVKLAPPDLTIPRKLRESYPEGDLARWKHGQTIHEIRLIR